MAADARDWATALAIVVPVIVMAYNTVQVRLTRRDMARLETNTNSKMDKLLEAKDAEAVARVGEASAVGEKFGRDAEIARQDARA